MTAWADRKNTRQGLQAGAVDYITKPFSLDEIAESVSSHLNRHKKREKSIFNYAINNVLPSVLRYLPHELRTPMNGILAPSELLMDTGHGMKPEEIVEMGKIINVSALRMLRLTENMEIFLSLKSKHSNSVIDNLGLQSYYNPNFLLERICRKAMVRNTFARENLVLKCLVEADIGVSADLEKVFDEVLDNAFQFADPGSQVFVTLEEIGNKGRLSVQNDGLGLLPSQLDSIDSFIQFDRDKIEQQGLGLGLFIARELALLNGASLNIQSSLEGPIHVQVLFPLFPAS